jgi:arginase
LPKRATAWFDAHGCLRQGNDHFSGLALMRGPAVLIGARAFSLAERAQIWQGRVRHLTVAAARRPIVVSNYVLETDADEVRLHLGLDVLDPAEFGGVVSPVSGGMTIAEVVRAVHAIAAALPVVEATIADCATTDPEQLKRLEPLRDAVGEVCGQRS